MKAKYQQRCEPTWIGMLAAGEAGDAGLPGDGGERRVAEAEDGLRLGPLDVLDQVAAAVLHGDGAGCRLLADVFGGQDITTLL